jgi:DGQHR domain-containing protein
LPSILSAYSTPSPLHDPRPPLPADLQPPRPHHPALCAALTRLPHPCQSLTGITEVEVIAEKAKNLDTVCYRGSAPLAHLALASRADIFDSVANPEGLQRDLSPTHASRAYEYTQRARDPEHPRAFPEVVLNVREKSAVTIEPLQDGEGSAELVRIRFNIAKCAAEGKIAVSRVDGNHRLFYAAGDDRREPMLAQAPFQLHVGLTREQEASLFVDINANQKGLNTSHLSVLRSNLTEEEREIRDHPARWMARRLADKDPQSPWFGIVHMGGSKEGARQQGLTRMVNFASLEAGVARTLTKSLYLHDITNAQAQYVVLRTYWQAVKQVFAEEWARPKEYLLLKNIGVMSLSILGGAVIDRCIARQTVDIETMARYLRQAQTRFDWGVGADGANGLAGMTGNRAAMIVAGEMASQLSDEFGGDSMQQLTNRLLQEPA